MNSSDIIIKRVDQARMLLIEARDARDAKKVMDMAHAAETYARRQKLSEEAIGYAHEIMIDAQRLLGDFRASGPKNKGASAGGKKTGPRGDYVEPRDTTPTLADLGLSKKVSADAQFLAIVAKEDPEEFEEIKKGKKTLHDARKKRKRKARVERTVEISRGNKELKSEVLYPVVLCDPPWRYEHVKTDNRAIENQYPTMPLAEICAMPFSKITTPDCICFMWATSPKLEESMQVIKAWGLTYRTCAVWVKDKIGMGYYFRQQHELLLVATRGELPVPEPSARVSSVINGTREKHSAKPKCVYNMIAGMYPDFPRIELFCREAQPGWAAWGNQS